MGVPSYNQYLNKYKAFKSLTNKNLANIQAAMDIEHRAIQNSGKVYDLFDGSNSLSMGKLDTTATTITSAYNAGVSTVAVASITGFVVGQEVTIYDDVNSEDKIIQSIGALQITFTTATANAYKLGAGVARSNVSINGGEMGFGSIALSNAINQSTPTTIVSSNFHTDSSCGRKLVRDSNGVLYVVMYDSVTYTQIQCYKSVDDGATWSDLYFPQQPLRSQYEPSIVVDSSNNLHVVCQGKDDTYNAQPQIRYRKYDGVSWSAPIIVNSDPSNSYGQFTPSIAIDSLNNLHVVWFGLDSTYTVGYQIKYSKSTNGGTSWSTSVRINSSPSDSYAQYDPSIAVDSSNNPHIVWRGPNTTYSSSQVKYSKSTNGGTSWSTSVIVNSSPSNSSNCQYPSIFIDSSNNMHVVWHGKDSTYNLTYQINYSKYNGASWSTSVTVNSSPSNSYNQYAPSITVDSLNNLHVVWYGNDAVYPSATQVKYSKSTNGGTSWSNYVYYTTDAVNSQWYPSLCSNYANFTEPLCIWQDSNLGIKFRAVFINTVVSTLLNGIARYNIVPYTNISDFAFWVQKDRSTPDSNFTLSGKISAQAVGGNESYSNLTQTTTNIDSTTAEEQLLATVNTTQQAATLKLILTRANNTVSNGIQKILGAIG
jgi:hypothetical protein